MTNPLLAASPLLLFLVAPGAAMQPPVGGAPEPQVRISQHIVIHVPRVTITTATVTARAMPAPMVWSEKKAAKCVRMDQLAGAAITSTDAVDLVLKEGGRLRARLGNECPALDFYSGFYVKPTRDGMLCAGRDSFRLRSGAECEIEKFRTLVAVPVDAKR